MAEREPQVRSHRQKSQYKRHRSEFIQPLNGTRVLRSKSGGFLPSQVTKPLSQSSPSSPKPRQSFLDPQTKEEILTTLKSWYGDETLSLSESCPSLRKKSNTKKLKQKLSRSNSKEKKLPLIRSAFSPIGSSQVRFSQQTTEIDARLTSEIALYYIHQRLPENFPTSILQSMFQQKAGKLYELERTLRNRGWYLRDFTPKHKYLPSYYFGPWSYDCWCIFEVFIDSSGAIVFKPMEKGPHVSFEVILKCGLSTEINRPPKRYICEMCGEDTPCQLLIGKEGHTSHLCKFRVSLPQRC